MKKQTKHRVFFITAFILFGFCVVSEVFMFVTALLDGQYYLTESTYRIHINSLGIALAVSNLAILFLLVLLVKKSNNRNL